jgi:hypothetical protein
MGSRGEHWYMENVENYSCKKVIFSGFITELFWMFFGIFGLNTDSVLRVKNSQNYVKQGKSTFAEKNIKLLHGPIFPILWEKLFFSSKTSLDRLK